MNLIPFPLADLITAGLIGDKRLILKEAIVMTQVEVTPVLGLFWECIMLLHPDEEPLSKVEEVVEVEEDLMADIAGQSAGFFELFLERLEVLKMVDVVSFGFEHFL